MEVAHRSRERVQRMGVVMESSAHHSLGDFELRVVTATEISFTCSAHVAV